jgi:hypothetical protein
MTRPVVGIFYRCNPMEDTPVTRTSVPRSRHLAYRCDGVGTGSARMICGTSPTRRGLSGRWDAESTRA